MGGVLVHDESMQMLWEGEESGDISEGRFAKETLERYSGCPAESFCSNLILTNFPKYVDYFAETRGIEIIEGSMFKVAHSVEEDISMLDFKIGSPAAALVVDLCSFLPVKAAILLNKSWIELTRSMRMVSARFNWCIMSKIT